MKSPLLGSMLALALCVSSIGTNEKTVGLIQADLPVIVLQGF
jgi:hypothetical protein